MTHLHMHRQVNDSTCIGDFSLLCMEIDTEMYKWPTCGAQETLECLAFNWMSLPHCPLDAQ